MLVLVVEALVALVVAAVVATPWPIVGLAVVVLAVPHEGLVVGHELVLQFPT